MQMSTNFRMKRKISKSSWLYKEDSPESWGTSFVLTGLFTLGLILLLLPSRYYGRDTLGFPNG